MARKLLQALINVAILCGLLYAGLSFQTLWSGFKLEHVFTLDLLFALFGAQLCLLFVTAIAWKFLLRSVSSSHLPWFGSIEQVGFMLVGKYIPGKVWGISIRAMTCSRYQLKAQKVVEASLVEQLVTLYVAIAFGGALYLFFWVPELSLALASGLILSGKFLINKGILLLGKLSGKASRYFKFVNITNQLHTVSYRQFLGLVCSYCLIWLAVFLNLWLVLQVCEVDVPLAQLLPFFAAYMVSVAVGFIAIFSPGGLGVRESSFIAMTSPFLDVFLVVQIAVAFRVWNAVYDILAGLISYLIFLANRNRKAVK